MEARDIQVQNREQKTGLDSIRAERPPGPTLSPLAIAFLVSELMRKKNYTTLQLAVRVCEYLEASCGGLHAELWYIQAGGWECAGSSHGISPKAAALFNPANFKAGVTQPKLIDEQYFVAPIGELGRLVILGKGAELVSPAYLVGVCAVITGVMQSLTHVSDVSFQTKVA